MKEFEQLTAANMETVTIGDVVAKDFRTAETFRKFGIDFCCGGDIPLAEACRAKGINPEELRREIEKVAEQPADRSQNFGAWELPFLADYIVNTHHVYLKENVGTIAAYAKKIAEVHGAHHPEVVQISQIFEKVVSDMEVHLREEEEQLFPAIRKIVELQKGGGERNAADIQELKELLATLTHEHDEIGAASHEIRRLANDFQVPQDVCNTFMITYRKLEEFEHDLHKHVHLENNILFPKAAKL